MRWIGKHKLLVTTAIVLIIAVTVLLSAVVKTEKEDNFGSAFGSVVNTIFQPISKATRNISYHISGMFNYKSLLEENELLKEENDKLHKQLIDSALNSKQLEELLELKNVLNYKKSNLIGEVVTANVVSVDSTNWMSIFSIDMGTEEGIEVNDIVMFGNNLVGKIISTGKGWSKVASIIDESNKISFLIKNNMNLLGVITGNDNGILSGYMVDARAKIQEGDELLTSGMGIYPKGLSIGKVSKIKYDSNRQLTMLEISPFTNFNILQKVTVVL